ncbi:hypothetical protein CYY_007421 [Polysphondylium violaceum]|uniref:DNA repair protein XRCC4 n=1 Tax=Polysphondylium violaceum TaxID=133409 RepID=A0A8J4UY16_9MYCE|nr:hypothetical protein CYY_007421 [Polysphondylium violaceum]
MNEVSLTKFENVPLGNNVVSLSTINCLLVKCIWQPTSFSIHITDFNSVWYSNVNTKYIETVLKPPGMSIDQYMKLIKESLIKQDIEKKQFNYKIEKSKSASIDIEFQIFIKLQEYDQINIKSPIQLIRSNSNDNSNVSGNTKGIATTQQFFEWVFDRYKYLEDQNLQLKTQNIDKQTQFDQLLDQNHLFIKEKDNLENELFNKFVIILNEKKTKIKEYKSKYLNLLTSVESKKNNDSVNDENKSCCKCNQNNSSIDNSSQNYEGSQEYMTPKKTRKRITPTPSSANENKMTFDEHSMTLGYIDDVDDYFKVPTTVRKKYKPNSDSSNNGSTTPPISTATATKTTTTTTTNTTTKNPTLPIHGKKKSPLKATPHSNHQYHQSPKKQLISNLISKTASTNHNYFPSMKPATPLKPKHKGLFGGYNDDDDDQDVEEDIGASALLNNL